MSVMDCREQKWKHLELITFFGYNHLLNFTNVNENII